MGFRAGEEKLETAATAIHSLWQSDAGEAKLCEFQTVGVPVAMAARMLMLLIVSSVLDAGRIVLYSSDEMLNVERRPRHRPDERGDSEFGMGSGGEYQGA